MNKTFTTKPSGTENPVEGAPYTWAFSGVNSYSTEYNAMAMTAFAQAEYATAISGAGNYVVSLDFMAPTVDFTGTDNTTKGIRIFLGSYFLSTIGSDGALSICTQSTGHTLQAENWYRLTARITLPSGNITATVKNLTTGADIATKSATAASTTIPKIRFDMPAVIKNPLYTQNWILYKEKEKVAAPVAPADIAGATYYIKNDFTAKPGADSSNSNLTWTTLSAFTYDTAYKALKHATPLKAEFTNALSIPGKYKFTMNFMVDDVSALGDEYRFQINDVFVMAIAANTGAVTVAGKAADYTLSDETWYTFEFVLSHPENEYEVNVINHSTGDVVCSNTTTSNKFAEGIKKIYISNKTTAQDNLYTQSYRLYKLPNNFEAVVDGENITASYILETAGNAVIAVALFDETTKAMDSIAFERFTDYTGVVKATIAKRAGCTAKAFLWNADTLAPLFDSIDSIGQ